MLWHLTLRITRSVGAEAQRGDLNPGKAQVLPSLCGLPSVIPSAPLVGDAGREAAGTAESQGREGCLDRIRPPATKALPPPRLGLCSSRWLGLSNKEINQHPKKKKKRWLGFPVHAPPAQNQLVSSWGTQPGLAPAHLLDLPFPRMFLFLTEHSEPGLDLLPTHGNTRFIHTACHHSCFAKIQPGPETRDPVKLGTLPSGRPTSRMMAQASLAGKKSISQGITPYFTVDGDCSHEVRR